MNKIKEIFLNDKTYLRKQNDDFYAFYPWGYPGEGFLIDSKLAFKSAIFVKLYMCSIISIAICIVILDIAVSLKHEVFFTISSIFFMTVTPLYSLVMYKIQVKKREFIITKNSDYTWIRFFVFIIYYVSQFGSGVIAAPYLPLPFMLIYAVSLIFTTHLFTTILLTRGCYFSANKQ